MNDIAHIIERLERATGPDRQLGRDVLLAGGWTKTCVGHFYGPLHQWSGPNGESCREDNLRCPMASIDAAVTLLPDGIYWMAAHGKLRPDEPLGACALYHDGCESPFLEAEGHSVAISICIAALKARAA